MKLRLIVLFSLLSLVSLRVPAQEPQADADAAPAESPAPAAPSTADPASATEPAQVPAEAPSEPPAETEARDLSPVAQVGDEIITADEFQRNLEQKVQIMQRQAGRPIVPDSRMRLGVLNDIIGARLLNILASDAGVTVTEEEVQEEFDRRRASLPSQTAYEGYLRKEGLTEEQLRRKLRTRLITEKYLRDQTKDIGVPEQRVHEEYDKWVAEGRLDRKTKTADFAHIFVRPLTDDAAGWEKARETVETARKRVTEGGEDFGKVAKEISQDAISAPRGGTYFEATEQLMFPELGERLFKLKIGEISEPFRTQRGWHIMRVIAHNEPGRVPYEKVKDQLEQGLTDQLKQKHIQELVEGERKIIKVEIFRKEGEEAQDEQNQEDAGDAAGAQDGAAS